VTARLAAVLLVGSALAGCPARDANLREPQLTHPPRTAAWLGEDAGAGQGTASTAETRYGGAFRLPLSDDWVWTMPDEGRWELSRLELNTPLIHGDEVLVGTSRWPGLFVLDRSTGRVLRRVETPGPVEAQPVRLPDGWLVVDSFGTLLRFDDAFAPVWPEAHNLAAPVSRSPAIVGDMIVIGTASDSVVAVGLDDGLWRWTYKRDVPRTATDLAILGAPTPTILGDEVLTGFADGAVVGLDLATGALRWQAPVGVGKFPDVQAEVLVHEGMILAAGFGGPVVALDARTHAVRWQADEAGASASMILAGGSLVTSDSRGRVQSLDPATGAVEWSWELQDRQFGPPIRAAGWILLGDVAGTLYALDRFEGKLAWKYQPEDGTHIAGIAAAPAVDGRQLLVPTAAGRLLSLVGDVGAGDDLAEEPRHRRDRVLGW
jgi:outer membrane protein assembly factor BamB